MTVLNWQTVMTVETFTRKNKRCFEKWNIRGDDRVTVMTVYINNCSDIVFFPSGLQHHHQFQFCHFWLGFLTIPCNNDQRALLERRNHCSGPWIHHGGTSLPLGLTSTEGGAAMVDGAAGAYCGGFISGGAGFAAATYAGATLYAGAGAYGCGCQYACDCPACCCPYACCPACCCPYACCPACCGPYAGCPACCGPYACGAYAAVYNCCCW